jgi:hypothetical protein
MGIAGPDLGTQRYLSAKRSGHRNFIPAVVLCTLWHAGYETLRGKNGANTRFRFGCNRAYSF